jgi:hypothetical protein
MKNLSLRERRRKALLAKIARLVRKRNEAIKTLVKAENLLPQLERRARLMDRPAKRRTADGPPLQPAAAPTFKQVHDAVAGIPQVEDDGLDIPPTLDRTRKLQAMADPRTKEKKAERRAVEKEKREADLRGKTRKMPPTGKAALDAIKTGG